MMSVQDSILSKLNVCELTKPIRFAGTTAILDPTRAVFPYRDYWKGDYRVDYPIIDERRAGYRPRIELRAPTIYSPPCDFELPSYCFKMAPETGVPCHETLLFDHALNLSTDALESIGESLGRGIARATAAQAKK